MKIINIDLDKYNLVKENQDFVLLRPILGTDRNYHLKSKKSGNGFLIDSRDNNPEKIEQEKLGDLVHYAWKIS